MERKLLDMMNQLSISEYNPRMKYCDNLPGVNSFAVLHPDLMNEWNHLDNYLLCDPDQILDNSISPVWWTCPVCAHDYKCSPKQRILYQERNMDACTFCKGLRRKERHYI